MLCGSVRMFEGSLLSTVQRRAPNSFVCLRESTVQRRAPNSKICRRYAHFTMLPHHYYIIFRPLFLTFGTIFPHFKSNYCEKTQRSYITNPILYVATLNVFRISCFESMEKSIRRSILSIEVKQTVAWRNQILLSILILMCAVPVLSQDDLLGTESLCCNRKLPFGFWKYALPPVSARAVVAWKGRRGN